ncbi:MAG TPA: hypothetical protein VJ727_11145 [Rhodanobacteraceae bacterium]|nr:hypothetical protein [Rhodanobacteraceae bacterium]
MNYTDAEISGMTVNERLFALGLDEEFEQAFASLDQARVSAVLRKAKLAEQQAEETASALLSNLEYYGYSKEGRLLHKWKNGKWLW